MWTKGKDHCHILAYHTDSRWIEFSLILKENLVNICNDIWHYESLLCLFNDSYLYEDFVTLKLQIFSELSFILCVRGNRKKVGEGNI